MTQELMALIRGGQIRSELTMLEAIGHIVLWLVISLITLGIGLFFWPYSAAKLIINRTVLYDAQGNRIGKLQCRLSASQQIGHILLWILLSLITLGLAFPLYTFGIARAALNNTEIA